MAHNSCLIVLIIRKFFNLGTVCTINELDLRTLLHRIFKNSNFENPKWLSHYCALIALCKV